MVTIRLGAQRKDLDIRVLALGSQCKSQREGLNVRVSGHLISLVIHQIKFGRTWWVLGWLA